MRANRRHQLDRSATEELLRGGEASGPAGPAAGHDTLASLLTVAAAPARDQELAGEAEAVAAFRNAFTGPAPQPRRPSMSLTKLLVAKAVIAAVGVTGGGVALAAATGHLPASFTGTPAPASSASTTAGPAASGQPAGHPTANPSPSLRGLCKAYAARVGSDPGKALDSPAFAALITAAGGKSQVTAYCTSLLAAKPGNRPGSHPNGKPSSPPAAAHATHATGKPASPPASHATGKPASPPASHATGKPASPPASHVTGAPKTALAGHGAGASASHP